MSLLRISALFDYRIKEGYFFKGGMIFSNHSICLFIALYTIILYHE